MNNYNFFYTNEEFINEVLETYVKSKDDFTQPLFENSEFMMLALKVFSYDVDEVIKRFSDKLWYYKID